MSGLLLTKPLLDAMGYALDAALAGDGFDGGDFDGLNRDHFERASDWVRRQSAKRAALREQKDASHDDHR